MKAVCFDAAGTLFRVRGSVGAAYAAVAARHSVVVAPEDIERRFRAAFYEMPPMCFPDVREGELPERERNWWRRVVRTAFAGSRFDDFEAFFIDLFDYFAHARSWELFSDVQPTLEVLKARGLRLAVVSNFDGRLIDICQGLGIADYFEAIVMSARVGYAKPDPRIFAVALARLGVAPDEALHVGDSVALDIVGARAAGLHAILIDRTAESSEADHRIRDLRELPVL